MKVSSLSVQILHLIIIITVPLIPLITTKYDLFYLCCILIIVLNWNIFKGECILSYYEKKLLDPNYKLGTNDNSLFKNLIGDSTANLIMSTNYIIIPYIIYRNYKTKNFPIIFGVFIAIIFLMILLKINTQKRESK